MTAVQGSNIAEASLKGADFSGANLSFADLSGAELHGAKFTNADLRGADFDGADLTDARILLAASGDVTTGPPRCAPPCTGAIRSSIASSVDNKDRSAGVSK